MPQLWPPSWLAENHWFNFISDLENGKETIQFGKVLVVASMLGLDLSIDVRGGAR